MKIIVADAAAHVRSALRLVLEQHPSVTCVLELATGDDLLEVIASKHVDLLLVDWRLPGLDIAALRHACPRTRVTVLSSRPEERRPALAAGADAFVCKGDSPEALLAGLALDADA